MKKVLKLLRQHLLEDFKASFFIAWLLFLALGIMLRFDGHNRLIELFTGSDPGLWVMPNHFAGYQYKILWEALLYAVPFFFTALLYAYHYGKMASFRKLGFWALSCVILFVVFSNHSLTFLYKDYLISSFDRNTHYFLSKLMFNVFTAFCYFTPPFLFWLAIKGYQRDGLYGFTTKDFDMRPYFLMLLVVFPIVVGASFWEAFLHTYPRYKFWKSGAEAYWGVSDWMTLSVYETSYMAQFIFLEFFFRGFFVIALAKYLDKGSVYVMVSIYCFIHFGKPMGECISSIIGGYILGVIAYYTRSVYGGVIVHMGVAAIMELAASFQIFVLDKQPH